MIKVPTNSPYFAPMVLVVFAAFGLVNVGVGCVLVIQNKSIIEKTTNATVYKPHLPPKQHNVEGGYDVDTNKIIQLYCSFMKFMRYPIQQRSI